MPESRAPCKNNLAANVALCYWSPRGRTYLYAKDVIAPQRRPSPTVLTQTLRLSLAERSILMEQ
jgi:hypothetical protein